MSAPHDDMDLRQAMQQAHAHTQPPSFDAMWARPKAPARLHPRRWALATASAGALGLCCALAVWTGQQTCRGHEPVAVSYGFSGWRAPSDALLVTPGSELLTTLPVFGVPLGLDVGGQDLEED